MEPLTVQITGIGCWAPGMCGHDALANASADPLWQPADAARPAATILPPGERRRAPESVLLACEVAQQACQAANQDPAVLASVFACTHGDLSITDYMCATLADQPQALSPTRFHNSVHNAAAGYWTIATQCHAPSTAISALDGTFAAGLLQAALQASTDDRPVLLVAYDARASGPFVQLTGNTLSFAAALLLDPRQDAAGLARVHLRHQDRPPAAAGPLPAQLADIATANSMARDALPLLCALVQGGAWQLHLPAGAQTRLAVESDR